MTTSEISIAIHSGKNSEQVVKFSGTNIIQPITANVWRLGEVAVFKAQMLNTPPKLNSSNNVQ